MMQLHQNEAVPQHWLNLNFHIFLYRIYVSIADILLTTYQAVNVFFVNPFPFQNAFSMCKVLA
jgi:hypothetical protein